MSQGQPSKFAEHSKLVKQAGTEKNRDDPSHLTLLCFIITTPVACLPARRQTEAKEKSPQSIQQHPMMITCTESSSDRRLRRDLSLRPAMRAR